MARLSPVRRVAFLARSIRRSAEGHEAEHLPREATDLDLARDAPIIATHLDFCRRRGRSDCAVNSTLLGAGVLLDLADVAPPCR